MRVGQRLFLAVVPAVLGVLTVAALSYYGRYAYVVPEWVVAIAIVAAGGSLVVAWVNTRYVARRIDRLAARVGESPTTAPVPSYGMPDELDAIERTVDRLSEAVSDAEAERRLQLDALAARRKEYADLMSQVSASVARALDDVRLPLHILLENRFGELNENQEEMLGAARTATEDAVSELQTLRDIADFDRNAIVLRDDVVRIGDVLASLTPMLIAEGAQRDIVARVDVAPGLPSIRGDRRRVQESVSTILLDALGATHEGSPFLVEAESDAQAVSITVTHGGKPAPPAHHALPSRLLAANGATLDEMPGRTVIRFAR